MKLCRTEFKLKYFIILMNKIVLFILFLLIIYISLFFVKLDKLDRSSLYNLGKYMYHDKTESKFSTKINCIINFLKIPFKHGLFMAHYSEGGMYSSYILKYLPNYSINMSNKLYWNDIFKKYNINHPTLVAYIENNKFHQVKPIKDNKKYICKPFNGMQGYKIFKIKGCDIKLNSHKYNNVLFQNMLNDCNVEGARHFRYVSLYNGKSFCLESLSNKESLVSNEASGAKSHICKKNKCVHLSQMENIAVRSMIRQLNRLHKTEFPLIFSIGWDIMIDCSQDNKLTPYCLEGNILHGTWGYPNKINKN